MQNIVHFPRFMGNCGLSLKEFKFCVLSKIKSLEPIILISFLPIFLSFQVDIYYIVQTV